MNLVQQLMNFNVQQAGFLTDLTDGSFLQLLALLDVPLGYGPAADPVLNHQYLNLAVDTPKDHTSGCKFTDGPRRFLTALRFSFGLLLVHRNHSACKSSPVRH